MFTITFPLWWKTLNGHNSIESVEFSEGKRSRIDFKWLVVPVEGGEDFVDVVARKKPSTFPSKLFSGSNYYIFTKDAIQFILEDQTIKKFFDWSKGKAFK